MDVIIVGAGIAGLAAAYRLQAEGLEVLVLEATDRAGGVIRSEQAEGYLVEHGPNSLQARTPLLEDLIEALGLKAEVVEANPAARKRYVVRGSTPVPLPTSPPALLTTRLFSLPAKLRLLREPFVRRGGAEEESVAAFVRRRLGPEFLTYAVNPFLAGIYAGDPEQLSLRHAFPRLHTFEQEYGSLLRGALHAARKGREQASRGLFSFREGLQALPRALAAALEDRLHCEASVVGLRRTGSGWEVDARQEGQRYTHTAAAVVYAAPLHRLRAAGLETTLDLTPLDEVPHPPVSVLALGFRREDVSHPLDGFGLLVPEVEPFRILGTLFSSTLFPGRAPEGHVLLTTFVGGTRNPELGLAPTAALRETVRADLQRLLGVRGTPAFVRHIRWERAIPQYVLGYGRIRDLFARLEREHPGLAFAGNYRQGISVGDAAASGEAAARRLL